MTPAKQAKSDAGTDTSNRRRVQGLDEALPSFEEAVATVDTLPDMLPLLSNVWAGQQAVRAFVKGTVEDFKVGWKPESV